MYNKFEQLKRPIRIIRIMYVICSSNLFVEVNIGDMKYLRKMKGIGPACSFSTERLTMTNIIVSDLHIGEIGPAENRPPTTTLLKSSFPAARTYDNHTFTIIRAICLGSSLTEDQVDDTFLATRVDPIRTTHRGNQYSLKQISRTDIEIKSRTRAITTSSIFLADSGVDANLLFLLKTRCFLNFLVHSVSLNSSSRLSYEAQFLVRGCRGARGRRSRRVFNCTSSI